MRLYCAGFSFSKFLKPTKWICRFVNLVNFFWKSVPFYYELAQHWSLGWTRYCLRMLLRLKFTGLLCLEKILLSFSEMSWNYSVIASLFSPLCSMHCIKSNTALSTEEKTKKLSHHWGGSLWFQFPSIYNSILELSQKIT